MTALLTMTPHRRHEPGDDPTPGQQTRDGRQPHLHRGHCIGTGTDCGDRWPPGGRPDSGWAHKPDSRLRTPWCHLCDSGEGPPHVHLRGGLPRRLPQRLGRRPRRGRRGQAAVSVPQISLPSPAPVHFRRLSCVSVCTKNTFKTSAAGRAPGRSPSSSTDVRDGGRDLGQARRAL